MSVCVCVCGVCVCVLLCVCVCYNSCKSNRVGSINSGFSLGYSGLELYVLGSRGFNLKLLGSHVCAYVVWACVPSVSVYVSNMYSVRTCVHVCMCVSACVRVCARVCEQSLCVCWGEGKGALLHLFSPPSLHYCLHGCGVYLRTTHTHTCTHPSNRSEHIIARNKKFWVMKLPTMLSMGTAKVGLKEERESKSKEDLGTNK